MVRRQRGRLGQSSLPEYHRNPQIADEACGLNGLYRRDVVD